MPADFCPADFGVLYYWNPAHLSAVGFTNPDTTELYAAINWKMLQVEYSDSLNNTFGFSDSSGSYYVEVQRQLGRHRERRTTSSAR